MSLTDALLGPALGPNAAKPLVTHYDDATGERVDLSGTTAGNWAAKAANLLRDECDVEPGTRVAALLPAHWQSATVLLALWSCGAELVTDPATADWVLTDVEPVGVGPGGGVVALSLDAFGQGLSGLPAGVVDFATEVRVHGDEFVAWGPVPGDAVAWDGASVDEVLAGARAAAAALDIGAGDRVLSTREWDTPDGLREGLLAVLAAGASLVQCRHPDPDRLARRAEAERATLRLSA